VTVAPAIAARVSPTGQQYTRFVLVLGALIALGPLTIDMYLPALPSLRDDLAATESQAQLTLTGMLLGLALGQLVIGPLSDALGRRLPLVAGLGVHAMSSVLCAIAPTVEVLTVVRVLQGFAGAAVSVVAMAMVRDLFDGLAVAKLMSRLMLVIGVAPILAPTLGGQVLRFTTWRGVFVVLTVAGLLLMTLAYVALRESLPVDQRRPARPRAVLSTYAGLFHDRTFVALAVIGGLMMAALFAYVSGASFVLQDGFGLTSQQFAIVFGLNSIALIGASQFNPWLIRRFKIINVMTGANLVAMVAAGVLLVTGITGFGGMAGAVIPMAVVLASAGLSMPNTPALALNRHGEAAGAAAAVLGFLQFGVGALIAPLVGAFGGHTAAPMGGVMLGVTALGGLLLLLVVRRDGAVQCFGSAAAEPLVVAAEVA
jgi:MFS transporter, DHA1 family, multidrug resistance protein